MNRVRALFFLGAALLAIVAAVRVLPGLPDRNPDPAGTRAETASAAQNPEALQLASLKLLQPELEVPTKQAAPLMVATIAPDEQPPLDMWVRVGTSAGFFDSLSLVTDAGLAPIAPAAKLEGSARLLASGWAGDTQLGIPLSDVLLSQCGRLVARTRIDGDRPDVASAVHPNLGRSGWTAILFAADLPQCDNAKLRAWAIVPASPAMLMPLIGTHDAGTIDPATATAYHLAALPLPGPADIEPLPAGEIDIASRRVNLRRCGGTDCSRVGQIEKGRYRVHIAARRDGWSLLVFGDRAGWVYDELYKTVP